MLVEDAKTKETVSKSKKLRDYLKLDNFIINEDSTWKSVFDNSVLIVIGYSCHCTVF